MNLEGEVQHQRTASACERCGCGKEVTGSRVQKAGGAKEKQETGFQGTGEGRRFPVWCTDLPETEHIEREDPGRRG